MTLGEALDKGMVLPSLYEGIRIWICGKCGSYLCYIGNTLLFTCQCHDGQLLI